MKDAVVVLRRYRTGKSAPGSDIGHCRELVETIDAYLSRHPAMGWDGVEPPHGWPGAPLPTAGRMAVMRHRAHGRP